ncbi:MAG TPA: hypothetical protein VGC76_05770 [Pyrinomonadaceae bacterium]
MLRKRHSGAGNYLRQTDTTHLGIDMSHINAEMTGVSANRFAAD